MNLEAQNRDPPKTRITPATANGSPSSLWSMLIPATRNPTRVSIAPKIHVSKSITFILFYWLFFLKSLLILTFEGFSLFGLYGLRLPFSGDLATFFLLFYAEVFFGVSAEEVSYTAQRVDKRG